MAVSATVNWRGRSSSSTGEHTYEVKFDALPRVGEMLELGSAIFRVTAVLHTASGVEIQTKCVRGKR
jgi:hypothetical protein